MVIFKVGDFRTRISVFDLGKGGRREGGKEGGGGGGGSVQDSIFANERVTFQVNKSKV